MNSNIPGWKNMKLANGWALIVSCYGLCWDFNSYKRARSLALPTILLLLLLSFSKKKEKTEFSSLSGLDEPIQSIKIKVETKSHAVNYLGK